MDQSEKQKTIQAGKIASEIKKWIKPQIKKGIPLLELAEKIESKIEELGGKPAFPTNLSINNVAAHYTPGHDDKTLAHGLLKVDFGVHIDGWVADNAFSVDLENSEQNKKLIKSSEDALKNAIKLVKGEIKNNSGDELKTSVFNISLSQIGKTVEEAIESYSFNPIRNLSGHSMKQYDLHSGSTVPNFDDKSGEKIKQGIYAIEPFSTTGSGRVHDGKPSGIYQMVSEKNVRSPIARDVLDLIKEEYNTLPFCSRWIVKKLGTKALFGLNELERNGNLHHFAQLIESSESLVSQTEETILIGESGNTMVTTI